MLKMMYPRSVKLCPEYFRCENDKFFGVYCIYSLIQIFENIFYQARLLQGVQKVWAVFQIQNLCHKNLKFIAN